MNELSVPDRLGGLINRCEVLRVELATAQVARDQSVSQEAIQIPPRDDTPEPTPETPETDERPWWRRLVDRF